MKLQERTIVMLIQDVWQDRQLIAELAQARRVLIAKGCVNVDLKTLAVEIGHTHTAIVFCAVTRQQAWDRLHLDREKELDGPQYKH